MDSHRWHRLPGFGELHDDEELDPIATREPSHPGGDRARRLLHPANRHDSRIPIPLGPIMLNASCGSRTRNRTALVYDFERYETALNDINHWLPAVFGDRKDPNHFAK